ncbi:MAG: ATP-binding cassette domain-containing protein [Candidatus Eremiobacteraeota bacterium]|nr:ATP-binding cassette domain-containing protein [Candidatus Eremiobacteraeota bacterium]
MLDVEHIRKDFGNVHAVRDVTFRIGRGATFGLLGPNGAGKTTTMRMILGILLPDGGKMTWDGARVDGKIRKRFGYLPEERGLYGKMKVREQVAYFGRLHGLVEPAITRRTEEWIERFALQEYGDRPCGELSKGNQQKVQLACAAVHEPELLVLDEPFSGLDPVNADILLERLRELKERGTTLVLSSHQMWQLEHLCDEFCIITAGETRVAGTLEDLRSNWSTRIVRVAPPTDSVRAVLERIPHTRLISQDGALDVEIPRETDLPALLRELVAAAAVTRFESIEPSLHDIYIRAIGERR